LVADFVDFCGLGAPMLFVEDGRSGGVELVCVVEEAVAEEGDGVCGVGEFVEKILCGHQ